MRQRRFTGVLILVLLAACIGGFLGGRYLVNRLQREFVPGATWAPPTAAAGGAEQATESAGPPASAAPTPSAAPVIGTPAPPVSIPVPPTEAIVGEATVIPMPLATETPTPTPTRSETFPFVARSVRHSVGDCPGSPQAYILGQVSDRSGRPLTDVRLLLDDEYGNQARTVSKAGQSDAGRYDFPISGPPRRFFLGIIDASGRALSQRVEIEHGRGIDAQATCHWVDWRQN